MKLQQKDNKVKIPKEKLPENKLFYNTIPPIIESDEYFSSIFTQKFNEINTRNIYNSNNWEIKYQSSLKTKIAYDTLKI